ncbi:MAG: 1-phosphofructokinase family hexose kinase [Nitrospirae bacterium]|nr:MAG: 1-phosphofructokinase family hexose kinase [Nitrospirota bacterium]
MPHKRVCEACLPIGRQEALTIIFELIGVVHTMIITVTLNPSIDRTIAVDDFAINSVRKGELMMCVPGGKGINVSRAVKALGGNTRALIITGGITGELIERKLREEYIDFTSLNIGNRSSRTCYGIIDRKNRTETIINELGPELTLSDMEMFKNLCRENISKGDIVAISGSAPRGVGGDYYRELVDIAKERGAMVLVDTSGENLRHAVEASPFIVKVNAEEMSRLISGDISMETVSPLLKKGIYAVIVTHGSSPLLVFYGEKLLKVKPPSVEVVNSWGCGDCFVAGLLFYIQNGYTLEEAVKFGTATAAANTLSYGAGFIKRDDVLRLLDEVEFVN